MHQAVEKIIDRLIESVASDKPFYTLKDCLSAGFPSFIVERIRIEINEMLKKEFRLQESKWVQTEQELIQAAWGDFQQVLFAHSRIPKNELHGITRRVTADIVQVYLEPRKYMAEYIYKNEEELAFDELVKRTDNLTVYKHFGRAIPLYMKKRNLATLEKKRCKLLIHNLDANLVASYSPQDWVKVLQPLFTLFGGKIDANLIQLFFEDKELYVTAKAFNELDEKITKDRFIEVLSNPDLPDVKLQEEFKEKFREELITQQREPEPFAEQERGQATEEEQPKPLLDNFTEDYSEEPAEETDGESFNTLFQTESSERLDRSIFEEFEEAPEADKIVESLNPEEQTEEEAGFTESPDTELYQAADSSENESLEEENHEQEISTEAPPKEPESEAAPETKDEIYVQEEEEIEEEDILYFSDSENADSETRLADEANEQDEEPQMWQQFLDADQMDEPAESPNNENNLIGEAFLKDEPEAEHEEPSADFSLQRYLASKESMFVLEIFGGNQRIYEDALGDIQLFSGWEKAANYIEKHIFSKSEIDMSSETAIAFIDDLQSYFEAYKS